MRFIGRTDELARINKILQKTNQSNILIYGRRRIGKSFLIKKSLENIEDIVIHYQCKEISIENTLDEISKLICSQLHLNYNILFNSVDELLKYLFECDRKIIFVLDEYPYLLKKVDGLNSIVQSYIDLYKYTSNLKLIVSGSQIEMMKNLIEYNSPLYGRFDEVIELKEHNYIETARYYPSFSNEEKLMLYSVFGGDPLLNSLVDESKNVVDNIIDIAVKEYSFLELTVNNLLNLELSRINYGNDILQAVAFGVKKNDDLVTKAHAKSPANLNHALNKLLELELIVKINPINDENNRKKTLYYLNNNTLRFYYTYIYKHANERINMDKYDFYENIIKNDFLSRYIPSIFENIAKQYLILRNKNKKIDPAFTKIGTYWYDDKINKTNGQFDLVTQDKNGYIFYECKYTKNKVDDKVVNDELHQLSKVNLGYYNLGFVSKNGFNLDTNKYILISLDDMYNENLIF